MTAIPQPLLRQLMRIMLCWPGPWQVQAHAVLHAVLAPSRQGIKDAQVHALLSAIWHEVPALFPSDVEPHICPSARHIKTACAEERTRILLCILCQRPSHNW